MHSSKVRSSLAMLFVLAATLALCVGLAWASPQLAGEAYLPLVVRNYPTPTVTPTSLPMPIANPGFELGEVDWTFFYNQGDPVLVSTVAHGGSFSAGLGDGSPNRVASISQQFTVPLQEPNLQYWQYVQSVEVCGAGYDSVVIYVNGVEFTFFDVCENLSRVDWARVVINLSSYEGQTIDLRMEFRSNESAESWFYADDFLFVASP